MYVYMGESISATIKPKYTFVIHITLIKEIERSISTCLSRFARGTYVAAARGASRRRILSATSGPSYIMHCMH